MEKGIKDSDSLCAEKFLNVDFSRLLFLLSLSIFILFSLHNLSSHILWFDEVNAWNIASYVNFFDLFKVTKHEGHLFIWYAILMPFAKHNLFYPHYMMFVNWLFMLISILLMWKYAPFNSLTKSFLTFSLPFKIYYYFARCYSIGILFLFGAVSLYPRRFEHPLIYSSLIILAANTSVMAIIGAFALGIIFLYELFVARKNLNISTKILNGVISIFILGSALVLIQLCNFSVPYYAFNSDWCNYNTLKNFFLGVNTINFKHLPLVICYSFLLIFSCRCFKNSVKSSFFLLITHMFLIIIFAKIYGGNLWHFSFLFIYLIISVWIYFSENKPDTNFQKFYLILFTVFSFLLIDYKVNYKYYNDICIDFRNYFIANISEYSKTKIFVYPNHCYVSTMFPYIEKYKLNIYNSQADNLRSLDFYINQWDNKDIDFKKISNKLGNDEYGYIFSLNMDNDDLLKAIKSDANNAALEITPYECILPVYVYKITKKRVKL